MSRKACFVLSAVIILLTLIYAALALGLWEVFTPQLAGLFRDTDLTWRIAILAVLGLLDYRLIRSLIMPKEENLDLLCRQGRELHDASAALAAPCRITVSRTLDYEGSRQPVRVYCGGVCTGKLPRGGQLTFESQRQDTQVNVRFPGLDARAVSCVLRCEAGAQYRLVFSLRDGSLLNSDIYGE